jgi:type I restriction enzyme S subunit
MTFPAYPLYQETASEFLGRVPAHWSLLHVKKIARLTYGDALSTEARNEEGTVAVFGSNGPVGIHDRANTKAPVIIVGRKGSHGAVNWSDNPVFVIDTAFFVDSTTTDCDLRWLSWAFQAANFSAVSQDTGVPGLAREMVHDHPFIAPPMREQSAIADFLDRETGKIDALVAEQERLIALLKEKRQAVISQAVTKGLDASAPMKDSGVAWLGQVPAHWEVTRLGRVTATKCDGPFGSGLKSEHYTECGVRVIRLQNIRMGHFDDTDAAFIDEEYFRVSLPGHDVQEGDLLIAGLGDDRNIVGRCCVAPAGVEPAMVKADCFRFRLFTQHALPAFMAMQLTAGSQFDAGMMSSGSTRSRIPLSVMATRSVALPPLAEQQELVEEIEARSRDFDTLTNEAHSAIALLRERRAALISAAVTGKIDVRGLVSSTEVAAA